MSPADAQAYLKNVLIPQHRDSILRFFLNKHLSLGVARDQAVIVFAKAYPQLVSAGYPLKHKEASWLHRISANRYHSFLNDKHLTA